MSVSCKNGIEIMVVWVGHDERGKIEGRHVKVDGKEEEELLCIKGLKNR